jgi:hypothetical protein
MKKMMKTKCLLFLSLLITPFFLSGQSSEKIIKLGSHLTYFSTGKRIQFETERNFSFIDLPLTVDIREDHSTHLGINIQVVNANGWYQEYALNRFSLNKNSSIEFVFEPLDGDVKHHLQVSTRFELGKYFSKNLNKGFLFGLALAVDPGIFYTRFVPNTSDGFPYELLNLDLGFSIVPRMEIKMGPKINLFLKAPIKMLNSTFTSFQLDNPILTDDERSNQNIESNLAFDQFEIQLGIQYRLH